MRRNTMSLQQVSVNENKERSKLLIHLWSELAQIIVQSRQGDKDKIISASGNSSTFNLLVEESKLVKEHINKIGTGEVITPEKPYSVEIQLCTKERDYMSLEIWTLYLTETNEPSPGLINNVTHQRMELLLKSALCVSRTTPAYKLSFRNLVDTFLMTFSIYMGSPPYETLGENYVECQVSQVIDPAFRLMLKLAYRTQLTLPSSPRSVYDQMMVKSDHFKIDMSPRRCRREEDLYNNSSENVTTSDDSQDVPSRLLFMADPFEKHAPRSRTSSESSAKSSAADKRIFAPFAERKRTTSEELFFPDIPFSNLVMSATLERGEELCLESNPELKDHSTKERGSSGTQTPTPVKIAGINEMNNSEQSTSSTTTKEAEDFVVIDVKPPFKSTGQPKREVEDFYMECKAASDLNLSFLQDDTENLNITEQLKTFEATANEYDELVRSLHSESPECG